MNKTQINEIVRQEVIKHEVKQGLEKIKLASSLIRIPEREFIDVQMIINSWIDKIDNQISRIQ